MKVRNDGSGKDVRNGDGIIEGERNVMKQKKQTENIRRILYNDNIRKNK